MVDNIHITTRVAERVSQAAAVVTKAAETGVRASPKESSKRSAGPFTLEDEVILLTLEARVTRTGEVQTSEAELLQRLMIKGSTPPKTLTLGAKVVRSNSR